MKGYSYKNGALLEDEQPIAFLTIRKRYTMLPPHEVDALGRKIAAALAIVDKLAVLNSWGLPHHAAAGTLDQFVHEARKAMIA